MCFQPLACGWLQDHSTVGAYLLLPEDWAKSPFGQRAPRDHELPYPAACCLSPVMQHIPPCNGKYSSELKDYDGYCKSVQSYPLLS